MLRRLAVPLVVLVVCSCGKRSSSSGTEIKVAAASDLARAFDEVGKAFQAETGIRATFTFKSTGLLATQIEEGAPFDLFAAANVSFVDKVIAAGVCDGSTRALYARGRIVAYTRGEALPSLEALTDPKYKKIGIANPEHAPYGLAARQAFEKLGLWDELQPKLVLGENIQVPMQWAKTGDVDVAIVALSLAVVADGGSSLPIDPALHAPLDQALVVCGKGPAAEAAQKFAAFVASDQGREIMNRYGFLLPGEAPAADQGGSGGGGGQGARGAIPRVSKAEVEKLVAAWLAAQNGGDFAAYQALYAERFSGIKRVGARSWKFDRKGWFADRGRMFKKAMTVSAEAPEIAVAAGMAVVRFRQTFEQGRFKDAGDKQLVVVETEDGLRIAREEMLRSTVLDGPGSPKATGFAVLDDGARWLVVGDVTGVDTTGTPELGAGGDGFTYSVREQVEGLGEAWTKLVGAPVTVYPSGATCTIAGYRALTVLSPHFGTEAEWGGDTDGDGTPDAAALEGTALAEEILSAGGASYLVADISGCAGGKDVVGVIGEPGVAFAAADDAALVEQARTKLAATDEYRALQDDYAQSYGGQGPWTEADPADEVSDVWRSRDGKHTYVLAGARAGDGCGDFSGALLVLYRVDKGALVPVGELGGAAFDGAVLVDTNRDGRPEVAAPAALWAWDGHSYASVYELDLGFRDCGC
jgi:molybdate transport system substrate-binding protein